MTQEIDPQSPTPSPPSGPESGSPLPHDLPHDQSFFGAALRQPLLDACEGHLTNLTWFRTDWQRGGALTGHATWQTDTAPQPVVVKLPVPPGELDWLQRLQPDRHALGPVVPTLIRGDRSLGGYDLAWAVMERLPHGPLDHHWGGCEVELLCDAAGRFHAACSVYPLAQPRDENWPDVLARSRKRLKDMMLPEQQRWNEAIKALQKKLPKIAKFWSAQVVPGWCHGDLHFGNAMTQTAPPGGPAVLFDLAKVYTGCWVEDAVYFEHIFWSRPSRLAGVDVVKTIAHSRRHYGLTNESDWPRLANIRRALLAAASPVDQGPTPNMNHLLASLAMLEKVTPLI